MSTRTLFLHLPKESPMTKLHPSLKLITLIIINLIAWIMEAPVPLLILVSSIILCFKIAMIPVRRIMRFFRFILLIVQAVLISYLLGSKIPGESVYITFPWGTYISETTLLYAFTMILRFLAMLFASTLLLATMTERDIVYGLVYLRLPYSLSFVVSLAFKTMGVFIDDFIKVRDAMTLRGVSFDKGSLLERAKNYASLGVPLAVLSIRRMIESSYVVAMRGLILGGRRTYFHEYKFKIYDLLLLVFLGVLLAITLLLKWTGPLSFPGWPLRR